MVYFRTGVYVLAAAITLSLTPLAAETATPDQGPDWCAFAKADLKLPSGEAFSCEVDKGLRCIKMNNYGCVKNSSHKPYLGQLTRSDGAAITDVDRHSIYGDPKWSLRVAIKTLSDYYLGGRKSAIRIAEKWSPWCDTDGSHLTHLGWVRTCTEDSPGAVPASFKGPRCEKPRPGGKPLPKQCGPCNCPNVMAAFYVKDANKGVSDDLLMFDAKGVPTANLNAVLRRVVWMELGYQPLPTFIQEAIDAYEP